MSKKHSGLLIITALIALGFVRVVFGTSEQTAIWIPFINFLGVPIALYGVFSRINKHCTDVVRGVFIFFFMILIVIAVLILTGVIILSALANDLILLLTLLISLPTDYYCIVFSKKE